MVYLREKSKGSFPDVTILHKSYLYLEAAPSCPSTSSHRCLRETPGSVGGTHLGEVNGLTCLGLVDLDLKIFSHS